MSLARLQKRKREGKDSSQREVKDLSQSLQETRRTRSF